MTLPDERYRAVKWAREFLTGLAFDRQKYPRISSEIRKESYMILRHFPETWNMEEAAEQAPSIFQKEPDPLYKMVKQHEQSKYKTEPADGQEATLIYVGDGRFQLRVYNKDHTFIDYNIRHSDLTVKIKDKDAYFYQDQKGNSWIDHSPETLGIKNEERT